MHKAALSPFATIAEHQALAVQQLLDETTGHFLHWIGLKRPAAMLTAEQCQQLSAIVTGARCLDWKLADTEGGLFDAIQRAARLSGVLSPTLLRVNFGEQALESSLRKRVMQFIFEKVFTSQ